MKSVSSSDMGFKGDTGKAVMSLLPGIALCELLPSNSKVRKILGLLAGLHANVDPDSRKIILVCTLCEVIDSMGDLYESLEVVSKVAEYGVATKYKPGSWRFVRPVNRYLSAAYRHILKYAFVEENDAESGLPHLAHAACCLMYLIELEALGFPCIHEDVEDLQKLLKVT